MFSSLIAPEEGILFFCKICPVKHTILLRHPLFFFHLSISGWSSHCISFLHHWNIWLFLILFLTLFYIIWFSFWGGLSHRPSTCTDLFFFNYSYSNMIASLAYLSLLYHAKKWCYVKYAPFHVPAFWSFGYAEQLCFCKLSSMDSHGIVMLATEKKSTLAEAKYGESAFSAGVRWWTVAGGRGMSAGSIVRSCSRHESMALVIGSPGQQP